MGQRQLPAPAGLRRRREAGQRPLSAVVCPPAFAGLLDLRRGSLGHSHPVLKQIHCHPCLQVHRGAVAPAADHASYQLGAGDAHADSEALLGASQVLTHLLDATAAAIAAASSHVPAFVQGVLARLFPAASSISAALPSPGVHSRTTAAGLVNTAYGSSGGLPGPAWRPLVQALPCTRVGTFFPPAPGEELSAYCRTCNHMAGSIPPPPAQPQAPQPALPSPPTPLASTHSLLVQTGRRWR